MNQTLPASYYVDPGIFERERERIFARSWWLLGPAERLTRPAMLLDDGIQCMGIVAMECLHLVCVVTVQTIFTQQAFAQRQA